MPAPEALEKVALGFAHHRKPSQLSGGQRQRVAVPALVNQPRCCCSMSRWAPDLKLREQMQVELKAAAVAGDHLHLRDPRPERSAVDVGSRGGV